MWLNTNTELLNVKSPDFWFDDDDKAQIDDWLKNSSNNVDVNIDDSILKNWLDVNE